MASVPTGGAVAASSGAAAGAAADAAPAEEKEEEKEESDDVSYKLFWHIFLFNFMYANIGYGFRSLRLNESKKQQINLAFSVTSPFYYTKM